MIRKINKGNGTREVLIEFLSIPVFEPEGTGQIADRLLAYLWIKGYKIVPLTDEDDKDAIHRGNAQMEKRRTPFRQ
jgi:hypothetical protein